MHPFLSCRHCKTALRTYQINQRLPPPDSVHYILPQPIEGLEYIEALAERCALAAMIEAATDKPLHDLTAAKERRAHYLKLASDAKSRAKWTPVRARADRILSGAKHYQDRADSAERTLAKLQRANADAQSDRAMVPLQTARLAELDAYLTATPCPHHDHAPRKVRKTNEQMAHTCRQIAAEIAETYQYFPEQGSFMNHKTGAILCPRFYNATTVAGEYLPWRWIAGTLIAPNLPRPVKSRAPKGANRWVRRNLSF